MNNLGEQTVTFAHDEQMHDIAAADGPYTMLIGYLDMNQRDPDARGLLYSDFVTQYWWDRRGGKPYKWLRRANNTRTVGRIYAFVESINQSIF